MSDADSLGVWLAGVRVAELVRGRGGAISCRYTEEALERWPENSPVLSCSLPLGSRPREALAFCKGLLPEGEALRAMAEQAGLATSQTFDLLARFGRDVAGALVIAEAEPEERRFGVEPLDGEGLEKAVEELGAHPLGVHDDSELSLAGLQDKLLLVELEDGSWGRPLHGRPSTHILKADDPFRPGLVEAEADCLALAHAVNLTSIETRLERIGERTCLIVPRFDRDIGPGGVHRVHQEDLCQALAIDPDGRERRAKYERAGGPRLRQAAELLDSYSRDPLGQLDRLVEIVTLTVLIGNADAHGKNLALLHPDPEHVELAPLYDTVPTALWPKLRSEAAMSIGAQVSLPDVTVADIVREARLWRHPADRAESVALSTIEAISDALDAEAIAPTSPVTGLVRGRVEELATPVR
jgi:serine/threonine-protein kinase HipA